MLLEHGNLSTPGIQPDNQRVINQVSIQPQRRVLLQVLPVQIQGQTRTIDTYAVLDAGSDSTLIRKDLADHLELSGEAHQLSLNTVGSDAKIHNLNIE